MIILCPLGLLFKEGFVLLKKIFYSEIILKSMERDGALYFSFEEAQKQIVRNMRSIGIMLEPWVKKGLLRFQTVRSTTYGLEMHLAIIHREVNNFKPQVIIIDPISNLGELATEIEIKGMLSRVIDFLKMQKITALFTDLSHAGSSLEESDRLIISYGHMGSPA